MRSWTVILAILFATSPALSRADDADDSKLDSPEQKEAPTAFAAANPRPVLQWGEGNGKSYLVPASEIIGYEFLLNRFDHYFSDPNVYPSPIDNLRTNLHRRWVVDNDKFSTNQFLHPYSGSIYDGFARSAGLGFWQSMGYAAAGSLLWEEAGESTAPSINDQVATGVGGVFLGEPLFRIASLLLESNANEGRSLWREVGATAISPSTGFNRLAFGDRFAGVFRSNDPAVFTRIDAGGTLNAHYSSNVRVDSDPSSPPVTQTLQQRHVASALFDMDYGLPGKTGYNYDRPFDYFHFEFGADTTNVFETIFSRGLLYGTAFELGANQRGIWGLYGSYDYFAPQVFRVSSTAVSLGATSQWWLSRQVALQGSAMAGLGYGAGGTIRGAGVTQASPLGEGERNYHYGATPQWLRHALFSGTERPSTRPCAITTSVASRPARARARRIYSGPTSRSPCACTICTALRFVTKKRAATVATSICQLPFKSLGQSLLGTHCWVTAGLVPLTGVPRPLNLRRTDV